jgi:hypothetical protein
MDFGLVSNKLPPAPKRRPPTMYSERLKLVFGLTDEAERKYFESEFSV